MKRLLDDKTVLKAGAMEIYQSQLIPGLPDEIALECLLRVPYSFHCGLKSVCRRWMTLLSSPFFYQQRMLAGKGEDFVFLVQSLAAGGSPSTKEKSSAGKAPPVYGVSVYCASGGGAWRRLPEAPALLPAGVPMFCQCVAVAGKLVVVGGWDPATLDSVADVYVYDLVGGGGWRRGASMSTARSFFACTAVGSAVYVAGGHDNQKNALRSAEVYDPDADRWRPLPDMADERDECHGAAGIVVTGAGDEGRPGFWVVSGYGTESQGRFGSSAEFFDPGRGSWTKVDGVWPNPNLSPRCASARPARPVRESEMTNTPSPIAIWYPDSGGNEGNSQRGIKEYDGKEMTWKVVGPMPDGIRSSSSLAVLEGPGGKAGRVFVVGSGPSEKGGNRHVAYSMDTEMKEWEAVDAPIGYTGFVFTTCSVHL